MERKNASYRRNREEQIGSFAPDDSFDEFTDSEIEIGDYSPGSGADDNGEDVDLPGKDGPGT